MPVPLTCCSSLKCTTRKFFTRATNLHSEGTLSRGCHGQVCSATLLWLTIYSLLCVPFLAAFALRKDLTPLNWCWCILHGLSVFQGFRIYFSKTSSALTSSESIEQQTIYNELDEGAQAGFQVHTSNNRSSCIAQQMSVFFNDLSTGGTMMFLYLPYSVYVFRHVTNQSNQRTDVSISIVCIYQIKPAF
ncbi:hypothetical protein F5880DRAFT_904228 [Lentinula raphanica]|nr:hypothetical protein F5880DRAFT_904228 [Lentinula raphanica]